MKKFLKILGILISLLIIGVAIFYAISNEKMPVGKQSAEADILAKKMLNALHYDAYKNTRFLEWSFRGKHFYKWDKQNNIANVSWDNNKVILYTKEPEKSKAFIDNKETKNDNLIQKATDLFNNDSFWLVAPYKIFEEGIERKIVKYNNKDALMITYSSGGTTPGDSYLWILDNTGKPIAYKMWVKIIPIGGMEASWSDWKTTKSGAILPTKHQLPIGTLDMGNVKGYN